MVVAQSGTVQSHVVPICSSATRLNDSVGAGQSEVVVIDNAEEVVEGVVVEDGGTVVIITVGTQSLAQSVAGGIIVGPGVLPVVVIVSGTIGGGTVIMTTVGTQSVTQYVAGGIVVVPGTLPVVVIVPGGPVGGTTVTTSVSTDLKDVIVPTGTSPGGVGTT